MIKLESGLMIPRNRIHLRKKYSHPKNDTNSTEPSNYIDDGDVKNNEPNDDSDDQFGNNFNQAVTATESSCDEPRPAVPKLFFTAPFENLRILPAP